MTATTETSVTTQVYRVYIRATAQTIWDAITRPEFTIHRIRKGWEGEVLFFDKFGNAFSNLHSSQVGKGALEVYWRRKRLPLYRTYSDMLSGKPGALFGSSGFLEIALRENSFENRCGARRSDPIRLLVAS